MVQIELTILRVSLTLTMLAVAGYKDFRYREVSDWIWIIFSSIGLPLDAYEIWIGNLSAMSLALALSFSALLAIGGWWFSLFGEADLLAFIVISIISPTTPILRVKPLLMPPIFFPLSLVSNSVLLGALSIFLVLAINIKDKQNWFEGYDGLSASIKIGLLLTARRKEIDSTKGPPFEYPLESIDENEFVHVSLWPDVSDDLKASETVRNLKEKGRTHVWVTYTHPFLFILLIGYIITILLGDVSLWIVSRFFF